MINGYHDEDIYFDVLKIENNIMRFAPKVNELNINQEIKNNEEVAQGFIINKKIRKENNKIMISFNEEYNKEYYNKKNNDGLNK